MRRVSERVTSGLDLRAGQPRFPRWQFTEEGVVAGITDLVEAFDSPVALTSW